MAVLHILSIFIHMLFKIIIHNVFFLLLLIYHLKLWSPSSGQGGFYFEKKRTPDISFYFVAILTQLMREDRGCFFYCTLRYTGCQCCTNTV